MRITYFARIFVIHLLTLVAKINIVSGLFLFFFFFAWGGGFSYCFYEAGYVFSFVCRTRMENCGFFSIVSCKISLSKFSFIKKKKKDNHFLLFSKSAIKLAQMENGSYLGYI